MMINPIQELIDCLATLPGIGKKTAARLAYHIAQRNDGFSARLKNALDNVEHALRLCEFCQDYCAESPCTLCSDSKRDRAKICVVETPGDLVAIENTREFDGLYHVLHGLISPLDGIGPDKIKIRALLERLRNEDVEEIILATSPSIEGEATALYIQKLLADIVPSVTRIASGLAIGTQVEYADSASLGRSIAERRKFGH